MSHYISVPCPNCGHPCEISSDQKSGICPCCGSKVLIAEEHIQNIQVKNENTIVVNDGEEDFIKRGNGFAKLGDWKLLFDCGKKMYERFPTSPWPYLFQAEAKSSLDFANLPKVSMAISDEEKKEYFEKASAAYLSSAPKGAAAYKGQLSNDDIDFLEEKTTLSFKKAAEAHPKKTTQIESRLESLKEDSEKSAIVDTFASKIALFQNDRSSLFYGYYLTWSKQVKACQANLIRFEDEVKEYIRQNAAKCTSLIRASVLESLPEASIAPYYIQRAKEEKAKIREASVPNNSGKLIKEAQAATKYKEETSKVWHQFRSLFIESIFLIFFLIWPSLVAILQEDAVYRAAFVFATFIFSGIVFIFVEHSIKKAGFDEELKANGEYLAYGCTSVLLLEVVYTILLIVRNYAELPSLAFALTIWIGSAIPLAFYLATFIRACSKQRRAKGAQAYLERCVQAVNKEEQSRKEQTSANHQAYLQKIQALNTELKNAAEGDQNRLDSLLDKMREYREGLLQQAAYPDEEALADSFDYRSDF